MTEKRYNYNDALSDSWFAEHFRMQLKTSDVHPDMKHLLQRMQMEADDFCLPEIEQGMCIEAGAKAIYNARFEATIASMDWDSLHPNYREPYLEQAKACAEAWGLKVRL